MVEIEENKILSLDDFSQTFHIDKKNIRGRFIKFGPLLNTILTKHDYPLPVSHLLSEVLILCAGLAATLKYQGIFSLEVKGQGPINFAMADVTSEGMVRAYAKFDKDKINPALSPFDHLGQGYLTFTVDQGEYSERYQGIIELSGKKLLDCILDYFTQSEQIQTYACLKIQNKKDDWMGRLLLIQTMPGFDNTDHNDLDDYWNYAKSVLDTITEKEIFHEDLNLNKFLGQLFYPEKFHLYPPSYLKAGCRCSEARIQTILKNFSTQQLEEFKIDQSIFVNCEFCNTRYYFDAKTLNPLS
ncbi:MAG: Hsp33 family molecular chaperone HslO [Alphaproteobacteria bacterium]|nr:Hsp33 family molecular chaperone HslO [Alphaproteobacteria bacterium]